MESNEELEEKGSETPDYPALASFNGRLNLARFAFSASTSTKGESLPDQKLAGDSDIVTPVASHQNNKRKLSALSPSPSPRKKSRSPGYAPPSTYAHLPELRDVLEPGLICVFIGLNPGIMTARSGHAYAHPSNLFWKQVTFLVLKNPSIILISHYICRYLMYTSVYDLFGNMYCFIR